MKELSIEEKAKAYDEALERARALAEKRILEEHPDAAICYMTKIEWEDEQ